MADEAVGVFVAGALPRTLRIAEMDIYFPSIGQVFMARHFFALVIGQAFEHVLRHALQRSGKALKRGIGAAVLHFGQAHAAALALDKRADARGVRRALYRSPLSWSKGPVARQLAGEDVKRALVHRNHADKAAPAGLCQSSACGAARGPDAASQ